MTRLTGDGTWFEDFTVGDRWRSARGTTVGEVENQLLTKLVLNTAQSHFNEHVMEGSPMGEGRLVFGLVTGSIVLGLATQDTAENALAEVAAVEPADRDDAGLVTFRHWGANQRDQIVFEAERTVLVRRRDHA